MGGPLRLGNCRRIRGCPRTVGGEPVAIVKAERSPKENGGGRGATSVSRSSLDLQELQPTGKSTRHTVCGLKRQRLRQRSGYLQRVTPSHRDKKRFPTVKFVEAGVTQKARSKV